MNPKRCPLTAKVRSRIRSKTVKGKRRLDYSSRHPVCAHAYVAHTDAHSRAEGRKNKRYMQACAHTYTHTCARGRKRESRQRRDIFRAKPSVQGASRSEICVQCLPPHPTSLPKHYGRAWCDMHARAVESRTPPGGRTRAHGFETEGQRRTKG